MKIFQKIFEWLGLIKYKTKTIHKHHIRTIKRPENDCKLYKDKEMEDIIELKKSGWTDKKIGQLLGRTEGAIRQMRYNRRCLK